jgi:putative tryptophan/tyrosine transport system substrate-binding protein
MQPQTALAPCCRHRAFRPMVRTCTCSQPGRRQLVIGLGGWLVVGSGASARPAHKVYRVGLVSAATPLADTVGPAPVNASARAFLQSLRELGYVEGQNLVFERRSAESRFERIPDIVAELIRLRVDVIVTTGTPAVRAARAATTTLPIVMATSFDPVEQGVVESLARPGGNVTGMALAVGPGIEAKRLQLLKAMLPSATRVAYLVSKGLDLDSDAGAASVRATARALGVTLLTAEYAPRRYHDAFAQIDRAGAEALFVASSSIAYAEGPLIVGFANRARLPGTFPFREAVEAGGLMSYGVNIVESFRRAAYYVDKVLKGVKPADLPIEQPTRLELVINMRTAQSLGLTVPRSLQLRADHVIR